MYMTVQSIGYIYTIEGGKDDDMNDDEAISFRTHSIIFAELQFSNIVV
jgi:hypothetical protein